MKNEPQECEVDGLITFNSISNGVLYPFLESSTRDDSNAKECFKNQENVPHYKYSLYLIEQRKLMLSHPMHFRKLILKT